jgi:hypothetical protein
MMRELTAAHGLWGGKFRIAWCRGRQRTQMGLCKFNMESRFAPYPEFVPETLSEWHTLRSPNEGGVKHIVLQQSVHALLPHIILVIVAPECTPTRALPVLYMMNCYLSVHVNRSCLLGPDGPSTRLVYMHTKP